MPSCHMKYFLAIVPPTELATRIDLFRAEWSKPSLPAHITVKAPNSLSEAHQWLPKVQALCQSVAPIAVRLEGVGQFSSTVVYWQVISEGVEALHQSLLTIINPPQAERVAYFEGPAFVPHLTLAHLSDSMHPAMLSTVYERATEHWLYPVNFTAQTLRIFRSNGTNQPYEVYMDLPLVGKTVA